MTRSLLVSAIVPACIAYQIAALPIPASGQGLFGGVRGVTRDSVSRQPLAQVRITAHNVSKGTERTAISGLDGTFIMPGLEPGLYDMAAARDGFARSIAHVEVAAPNTHRVDFLLAADYPPAREVKNSPATAALPMTAVEEELEALKRRIGELEVALKARAANAAPPAEAPVLAAASAPDNTEPAAPVTTPSSPEPPSAAQQPVLPHAPAPSFPEALQSPDPSPTPDNETPFAFADFSWLNGNPRNNPVLDTKFFTAEARFDTHFMTDFNQPRDHSMGGATESFRSGEFQVEQISVGGDFHWNNVRGRILTMFGLFATTTPRNDASTAVGQWDVANAYRYVSEAWGGYHFNVNHGLNVDAGIFVSYIGLFSYYNFDNWTYQPSFVSSNTPWFFNGLRIQWFPTNKLKIEPWIINGWQSYNRFNGHHGFGGQILYRPKEWLSLVSNNYGNGTDTLGQPNRVRFHTDNSIEVRYYNKPESTGLSKMAFSVTGDAGCEYGQGGGTSCTGKGAPKQSFLGWMAYNRFWFHKDLLALTLGGGMMNNPGRYLTLLPPINGATASTGTPYFTQNPGDKAHMWDATVNLQYMPKKYITWWFEGGYRHSDVPYWSGRGGITPPGGNNGAPGQFACLTGAPSGTNDLTTAIANCGGPGTVWFPDLRHGQAVISAGVLVKF